MWSGATWKKTSGPAEVPLIPLLLISCRESPMLAWKLFYSNGSQKKSLSSISISLVKGKPFTNANTVRVIPGKQFCTLCEGTKPGKIKELYIHTGLYKYALIQIRVGKVKYSSLVLAVSFNCGRNDTWQWVMDRSEHTSLRVAWNRGLSCDFVPSLAASWYIRGRHLRDSIFVTPS